MPNVRIAPTLATMHEIYGLSRKGGPDSPRFKEYVARVEHEWGLVAYNPMAGDAALDAVVQLQELDAENLALQTAESVCTLCDHDDSITLAIAVRSKGLWTDRIATEVAKQRTLAREGLAYALATRFSGSSRYNAELAPDETATVIEAMEILGDTRIAGDIAGVLFGDSVAEVMGWTPLGIAENAGYRWAVARAELQLQQVGAARALRAGVT